MNFRATPLQFFYFFALLFSVLFFFRGVKEKRLADKLLGFLVLLLGFEIQDYTFGFSGINVLWRELNGFPRGLTLLVGPTLYFYLRAQINTDFKFKWLDILHLIPWFLKFVIELSVFIQGPSAVQAFQISELSSQLGLLERVVRYGSYITYFYLSIRLYQEYKKWTYQNVSNVETVSFKWFRNIVFGITFCFIIKESINTFSNIYNLEFYQDWYWNLVIGVMILYLSIKGYTQEQPKSLNFSDQEEKNTKAESLDFEPLAAKLDSIISGKKPFLQPDLNISKVSKLAGMSISEVSSVINQHYQQNFNDFINTKRINEFKTEIVKDENKGYTLLAVAMDCGFNSKSTFNRAFKKQEGVSPNQWLEHTRNL